MENQTLTKEELRLAREWIADCVWQDLESEELDDLSDEEITRGIRRHFSGGISAFKETCQ